MFPHLCGTWCTIFIFSHMNEIPPHPFKAFPSYLPQTLCTWCLTTSASTTLSPAYFVHLPPNEGPQSLPSSAAVGAWLAAIFRHFWEEAGIRVPRSPSVYTHREQAVTEWMRESRGEWWSVASLSCILASPQHSHSLFCRGSLNSIVSSIFLSGANQSFQSTNQWTVCLQWILLRQAVYQHKVSLLSVSLWNRQSQKANRKLCAQF